jgi:hypothetical protein
VGVIRSRATRIQRRRQQGTRRRCDAHKPGQGCQRSAQPTDSTNSLDVSLESIDDHFRNRLLVRSCFCFDGRPQLIGHTNRTRLLNGHERSPHRSSQNKTRSQNQSSTDRECHRSAPPARAGQRQGRHDGDGQTCDPFSWLHLAQNFQIRRQSRQDIHQDRLHQFRILRIRSINKIATSQSHGIADINKQRFHGTHLFISIR